MSSRQNDAGTAPIPNANHHIHESKSLDVQVRLQYLKDDPIYSTQKPLQITPNFLDKEHKTNVQLAPGEVETISDVRGKEHQFSLDANGFQYVHAPTQFKDWSSQPKIAHDYLPELESLLRKEIDGCDEIMFYDARIRHSDDAGLRVEGLSYNPFAKQVHTDNTEKSVLMKIRNLCEIKADWLLKGRARIINIWRPIKHPVYDCGLAVADGGKLRQGDILECDRHRQDTGEFWDTMGVVKYRSGFDWYYMSLQDEPDVLLFKNYDSATDVSARTCLHTAFDLPEVPSGSPTRESIEVRALIFTYPEGARRPSAHWSMPHPLAEKLEQSDLQRVDVHHSIMAGHVRHDIDEGNEVPDAVSLLRRRHTQALQAERDSLKEQVDILTRHSDALQKQVSGLTKRLQQNAPDLRDEVQGLEAQLVDLRMQSRMAPTDNLGFASCAPDEWTILSQQLERANREAEVWKAEALGHGYQAVSRAWQSSVDEAVRRERQKDAAVIDGLRARIRRLEAEVTAPGL
ncbi:hypothetical protein AC579_6754 [Lecanosticta acicola]|uniref:Uncharacterized protein n=1 Tax=Lecanosticta acicola TaxID=111012 RepID=A0AAI8Z351_9PEZI|nr:hypothetical protein AC579_6754 [Lecanosticta acicola]